MNRFIAGVLVWSIASGCAGTPTRPSLPPVEPTPALAEAMARLKFMRGIWAGIATGTDHRGKKYKVIQTERMGPMLGGDIIVIEGRGYKEDKTTGFNAFAVVSWNQHTKKYEFRSYTQGMAGTFELKLTDDGYIWEIPAGSGAIVRFTATVKDGHWHEVGNYIAGGRSPVKTFEMNLKKVGDTDWPLQTPVPPAAAQASR